MPAALTVRPVRRLVVPLAALCAGAGFASVRPPDRLAAATLRPDGFVVVPLRDAQLTVRRLPLRPDDGNPAAADPRDEPVSGPTQAILVLAGLIGWIAARRSR